MSHLTKIQQYLNTLCETGIVEMPYEESELLSALLGTITDLDVDPIFGDGDIGYRPVLGFRLTLRL